MSSGPEPAMSLPQSGTGYVELHLPVYRQTAMRVMSFLLILGAGQVEDSLKIVNFLRFASSCRYFSRPFPFLHTEHRHGSLQVICRKPCRFVSESSFRFSSPSISGLCSGFVERNSRLFLENSGNAVRVGCHAGSLTRQSNPDHAWKNPVGFLLRRGTDLRSTTG